MTSSTTGTSNVGTTLLRTLHRVHRQLTDVRERLDRGPRQVRAAETHVEHCESQLTAVKAEAKAIRMAGDQKQLQLKTSEDKVKDLRRKLNAATSNREYQLLLEQIAADEMANSVLADEILELLEKTDEFQKNVADTEAALAAARRKAEEVRAEVAKVEPSLRDDVARLEVELRQAEATLPDDIRDLYNRVVRQKGEDALAVIENQCCGGCNQQVPLNYCNMVLLGKPVACKTCGRLLYLPDARD
jgi:predicted  nucleic acid-binding Zn-ribbon protein